MHALGGEVQVFHARAPLPVVHLDLGPRDGLPGHRREQLEVEGVHRGPWKPLVSLLFTQFFIVSIELPNL